MGNYTCMIIDDEEDAIDYLADLIKEHCPFLKIVATSTNSVSVRNKYFYHLPDLLFMDIHVDDKDGFEIYRDLYREKLRPYLIFVTAFNQYAIQAFKANALDYLLKPVSSEELKTSVQKFINNYEKVLQFEKIKALIEGNDQKIKLNTRTGYLMINPDEIMYLVADRNYTKVFTSPADFKIITQNIGRIEKILKTENFQRINRGLVVNRYYISEINRGEKICYLKKDSIKVALPFSHSDFIF